MAHRGPIEQVKLWRAVLDNFGQCDDGLHPIATTSMAGSSSTPFRPFSSSSSSSSSSSCGGDGSSSSSSSTVARSGHFQFITAYESALQLKDSTVPRSSWPRLVKKMQVPAKLAKACCGPADAQQPSPTPRQQAALMCLRVLLTNATLTAQVNLSSTGPAAGLAWISDVFQQLQQSGFLPQLSQLLTAATDSLCSVDEQELQLSAGVPLEAAFSRSDLPDRVVNTVILQNYVKQLLLMMQALYGLQQANTAAAAQLACLDEAAVVIPALRLAATAMQCFCCCSTNQSLTADYAELFYAGRGTAIQLLAALHTDYCPSNRFKALLQQPSLLLQATSMVAAFNTYAVQSNPAASVSSRARQSSVQLMQALKCSDRGFQMVADMWPPAQLTGPQFEFKAAWGILRVMATAAAAVIQQLTAPLHQQQQCVLRLSKQGQLQLLHTIPEALLHWVSRLDIRVTRYACLAGLALKVCSIVLSDLVMLHQDASASTQQLQHSLLLPPTDIAELISLVTSVCRPLLSYMQTGIPCSSCISRLDEPTGLSHAQPVLCSLACVFDAVTRHYGYAGFMPGTSAERFWQSEMQPWGGSGNIAQQWLTVNSSSSSSSSNGVGANTDLRLKVLQAWHANGVDVLQLMEAHVRVNIGQALEATPACTSFKLARLWSESDIMLVPDSPEDLTARQAAARQLQYLFSFACSTLKLYAACIKQAATARKVSVSEMLTLLLEAGLVDIVAVAFRSANGALLALQDRAVHAAPTPALHRSSTRSLRNQVHGSAVAAIPCLVLLGRCYLLWAQLLQEVVKSRPALQLLQDKPELHRGMNHLLQHFLRLFADQFQPQGNDGSGSAAVQLLAAGYNIQPAIQLWEAAAASCAAAAAAGLSAPSVKESTQCLIDVAHAFNALPNSLVCNNPYCTNLEGISELYLVKGKNRICSACRTARYCSKECQHQHWKQHKPACAAIQTAATAAVTAASP